MRFSLLITIAIVICTASCRFPLKLTTIHTDTEPYVQLKNGKKIEGSLPKLKERAFTKTKITVGDTTVKAKDVAFYSARGTNYANVSKRSASFASQVAAGKINVYKSEHTYQTYSAPSPGYGGMGRMSTRHSINYYVQQKYGSPVLSLSYNNLKPMIQKKTPEFKMLENYRKTRIVSRSLGYGSMALLAGGIALVRSENEKTSDMGVAFIGAATATFFGWLGVYLPNKMKLYKTVVIADGLEHKKTKRHRRGHD